ncbi:DUF2252 domain-containing protein [Pseudenhygromyxa sp. WMMC2535]|uniref:DUF2252 family protein n=1 Tax=Pseudenhygromyxa sp. WMMC2535 TaxID=2712867 RepID=UPI001556E76D|nr:DUF2252 domain-containing protein [Pseudenhygromyxa sp. WMMC2535]
MSARRQRLPTILLPLLFACGSAELDDADADADALREFTAATRDAELLATIAAHDASLSTSDRSAKHCKMAASPFAFFRGTNYLFWSDLADDERLADFGDDAQTRIWIQGDLHAFNYGAFDDDDGRVIYDLNDFDEAVIADYQWDLWRMATSLVLVAEDNGGFSSSDIDDFLDAFTEHYLDAMADYAANDDENSTRFTAANTYGLLDDFLDEVEDEGSREDLLDEWTTTTSAGRVFDLGNDELAAIDASLRAAIESAWSSYVTTTAGDLAQTSGYFTIEDVAQRLGAGIGSLGTPRYYVLVDGPSSDEDDDRILDLKRQGEPTPYAFVDAGARAWLDALTTDNAQRVVLAQRGLAIGADDHLGWLSLPDGDYSVRERSPFKDTFPTEDLDSETRFTKLAEQWGTILATAHARADEDYLDTVIPHDIDEQIDLRTDGEHAAFRALVREVASEYADQVALDYAAFAAQVAQSQSCP